MKTHALLAVLAMGILGCSGDQAAESPPANGSLNVTQGGAQDFEQFRTIIEEGGVPAPDLLDPVGFMAEHAMDLPPADCGQSICIHPSLSVMPRFNGGNWTMAFIAMNTPIDPAELERPPMHLVVAIEEAPGLAGHASLGVFDGMLAALRPEDRVTVVSYGSVATVVGRALEAQEAHDALLYASMQSLDGTVNLYDALVTARSEIRDLSDYAGRVLLITTGRADAGITEPEHIIELGETMASESIALGVVGFGPDYEATIASELGGLGAGTYSYASNISDLTEVLTIEGETALYPLATSFTMRIEPSPGYRVGRVYGVKRAFVDGTAAVLEMPALFIGQRAGAKDLGGSRRGGGGGLFVELWADPASGIPAGQAAYVMTASWNDAEGAQTAETPVFNELPPGVNPTGMWPFFSVPSQAKPYMVLNMYLAFKATVELFAGGDCSRAMGVSQMMAPSIEGWQGNYADPDIADDYDLMLRLRQNLDAPCQGVTIKEPRDIDAGCGFL